MNSADGSSIHDPLIDLCLPDFECACEDSRLDGFETAESVSQITEDQRQAAFELARSAGMCRILNVPLPEDLDGDMPPVMALAAANCLCEYTADLIRAMEQAPARMQQMLTGDERLDYCTDLVDVRFACMAVLKAVSDSWISAADHDSPLATDLRTCLETIREFLDDLDDTMEEHADLFGPLAETPYFENWRMRWATCSELPPPSWITGGLEVSLQRGPIVRPAKAVDIRSDALSRREQYSLQASTAQSSAFRQLLWQSPDGNSLAEMIIPAVIVDPADEVWVLRIRRGDDRDTSARKVSLAGLPGRTLSTDAEAAFQMDELAEQSQPMVLLVDDVEWPLISLFGSDAGTD